MFHGQGQMKWADGRVHIGEFQKGLEHGKGEYREGPNKQATFGWWECGKLIEEYTWEAYETVEVNPK